MKRKNFSNLLTGLILLVVIGICGMVARDGAMEAGFGGMESEAVAEASLSFRNEDLREEHYQKHGVEMGFASAKEYEEAANRVVADSNALHKLEAEDGDDVYYLEETNEFVIVSTDGYLRTYFCPEDGMDYYERQ